MFTTAMLFGSNMILQRNKPILIWGTGTPDSMITGTLTLQNTIHTEKGVTDPAILHTCTALVESTGHWSMTFPSMDAQESLCLTLTDSEQTTVYDHIMVGEVWIAGGQSNMEYHLHFDAEKQSVLEGKLSQKIRFFDVPKMSYPDATKDFDFAAFGFWRSATPEDLPYFSACGYYFAQRLEENLNIPIGIIGCNWGGTPACTWMDPSYLYDTPGEVWITEYEAGAKKVDLENYRKDFLANPMSNRTQPLNKGEGILSRLTFPGLTYQEQQDFLRFMSQQNLSTLTNLVHGPYSEKRPGGLYSNMVTAIAPYPVAGVIWYQGESDSPHCDLYRSVFSRMIDCWRDLWSEELPFLFVQLAPYGQWLDQNGENFPTLREQQSQVAAQKSSVWMASSSDSGMEFDIHPKHKRPIGERLALLASAHIYGLAVEADAPEAIVCDLLETHLVITFKHSNGLYIMGETLNAFAIKRNGVPLPYKDVNIVKDLLHIEADPSYPFSTGDCVEFAWSPYYQVNLYNRSHVPAKPFRYQL